MLTHSSSTVSFSFYKNNSFDNNKELLIGDFDKERQAFRIRFIDPEILSDRQWWCPHSFLETYLMDFFHFLYQDTKKPDGFQVDCLMFPSIMLALAKNDEKVRDMLQKVLCILNVFATSGKRPTPNPN